MVHIPLDRVGKEPSRKISWQEFQNHPEHGFWWRKWSWSTSPVSLSWCCQCWLSYSNLEPDPWSQGRWTWLSEFWRLEPRLWFGSLIWLDWSWSSDSAMWFSKIKLGLWLFQIYLCYLLIYISSVVGSLCKGLGSNWSLKPQVQFQTFFLSQKLQLLLQNFSLKSTAPALAPRK